MSLTVRGQDGAQALPVEGLYVDRVGVPQTGQRAAVLLRELGVPQEDVADDGPLVVDHVPVGADGPGGGQVVLEEGGDAGDVGRVEEELDDLPLHAGHECLRVHVRGAVVPACKQMLYCSCMRGEGYEVTRKSGKKEGLGL